jgi:antirestriction protein ArdC
LSAVLNGNVSHALRNDNKCIFQAASAAQKAVVYLDSLKPQNAPTVLPRTIAAGSISDSPQP